MQRAVLSLTLVLWSASAAASDCTKSTSTASLQSALDGAEAAFGRVDVDGFREALGTAREGLPCLGEAVTTPMAAQLHRMEGLAAFVDANEERAVNAFAAARSIEPKYTFPSAVVPSGNPVLERYQQRDPGSEKLELPPPVDGALRIDGRSVITKSSELPALLQVVGDDGKPTVSSYLWPTDPLPYEASATPRGNPKVLKLGLLAGGATVAAAGLGTLVAGITTQPTTDDTLDKAFAKSSTNDTLTGIGGALAVLGGAGIGISFLIPTQDR